MIFSLKSSPARFASVVAMFSLFLVGAMPKQPLGFEIFYDGAWHNVAAVDDVLASNPVTIRHGQGDESPAPRPSQITARLANDDDQYRTSNPAGPLYGKVGRNTPARVSVAGSVRGVVEASAWNTGQTQDFRRIPRRGSSWVDFEGGGILQRVNQWTQPLKSAFRTYNESLDHVTMYFPMEQARTTTKPVPTFSGPEGFAFSGGVSFGSQTYPPSSAPVMDMNDKGGVNLYTNSAPSSTSTTGWQVSWIQRLEPLDASDAYTFSLNTTGGGGGGDAFQIVIKPSTGEISVQGSNSNVGAGFFMNVTKTTSGYDFSQWSMWTIDATYSAGTTSLYVNWTNVDNSESRFINSTFAHEPGTVTSMAADAGTGLVPAGSTFGHFIAVDVGSSGGVDLFDADRIYAWTGYKGELAALRFARLMFDAGIPYYNSFSYLRSMPMGPLTIAPLPEQLKELEATEDGLIYDYRPAAGLIFLTRNDRYNRSVALALTVYDMPSLPVEVIDDQNVHNIVTASQRDGGEVTAEDSTGPMGTAPPPDGVGEYKQTIEVNLDDPDAMLPHLANWWMRRGTVNSPRYPEITLDLTSMSSAMITAVESVFIGTVITISGYREDLIRLHVIGYQEIIDTHSRYIKFACEPDWQFVVAKYSTSAYRSDSPGTTLNTSYSATATSMVVTFADSSYAWSTTGTPYDWMIAGERVTVTSMGAVVGAGPYTQTATVARSVNGVSKSQVSGESVHVHQDVLARYAL